MSMLLFSEIQYVIKEMMIYIVIATRAAKIEGFRQFLTLIYNYYEEFQEKYFLCSSCSRHSFLSINFLCNIGWMIFLLCHWIKNDFITCLSMDHSLLFVVQCTNVYFIRSNILSCLQIPAILFIWYIQSFFNAYVNTIAQFRITTWTYEICPKASNTMKYFTKER